MRFAVGAHNAAYSSHFEHSVSADSGAVRFVDFAPVFSIIFLKACGFSSIGQGRSILSLNG